MFCCRFQPACVRRIDWSAEVERAHDRLVLESRQRLDHDRHVHGVQQGTVVQRINRRQRQGQSLRHLDIPRVRALPGVRTPTANGRNTHEIDANHRPLGYRVPDDSTA